MRRFSGEQQLLNGQRTEPTTLKPLSGLPYARQELKLKP